MKDTNTQGHTAKNSVETKREIETTKREIREQAGEISESLSETAREATDAAKSGVMDRVESGKNQLAGEVSGIASALRVAADEMRSDSPQERTFAQIANGLADASDSLRDKDMGQIAAELSDFAKRNPMAFLAGGLFLGFAATRFAKASSAPANNEESRRYSPVGQQEAKGRPVTGHHHTSDRRAV